MAQNEKILANVLEIFRRNPKKQYQVEQIDRMLKRDRLGNFSDIVKALSFLEQEKKLITDGNGHYQLAQENTIVDGIFKSNSKGFGFVRVEDEETDDIFVAKDYTAYAVDGDQVRVKITAGGNPWNGKGPEGQVQEIIERNLTSLVGEFHPMTDEQVKTSHFIGYVVSTNKKLANYRVYIGENGLKPQKGDMVKVSISNYPDQDNSDSMTGVVIQVIGNKSLPGVDIMAIVSAHDVKTEWVQKDKFRKLLNVI